jgi:exoribonuclease-2
LFLFVDSGSTSTTDRQRILHPPFEGKLVYGFEGMDVGHRIRVQLIHTDVEQGFIDFKRIG